MKRIRSMLSEFFREPEAKRLGQPKPKVGDIILRFELEGCMAHDRKFIWCGQIEQFFHAAGAGVPCCLVEILYGRFQSNDCVRVTSIIPRLTMLAPGLWLECI